MCFVPCPGWWVLVCSHGEYIELVESGIIDPTKVVRVALEDDFSVAGVMLQTGAILTDVREPEQKPARKRFEEGRSRWW